MAVPTFHRSNAAGAAGVRSVPPAKKRLFGLAAALAAVSLVGVAAASGQTNAVSQSRSLAQMHPTYRQGAPNQRSTFAQREHYKELYGVLPPSGVNEATLDLQAASSQTVPVWSGSIVSPVNRVKYNYRMVGTSPFLGTKSSTTVGYVLVELRFHFSDGTVLDPTLPSCGDNQSVVTRVLNSPVIAKNIAYGSGTTQFEDAFQRANFWKYTKSTGYHVLINKTGAILFDITVPASEGFTHDLGTGCPPLGEVNYTWFDNGYKQALKKYVNKPNQLALGINYNTVLYNGSPNNCCTLGYHGSVGIGSGTQTYSESAYPDQGTFSGWNTATLSHEIGEWMNDPFGTDPTPAWGHTGQVSGCQNNLEVGDPLSGTVFNVKDNGFTYEVQDLAYFSWFYRQSPSIGFGGSYSFGGTFTKDAGPICH